MRVPLPILEETVSVMKLAPLELAQMKQKTAESPQPQFINKVGDDRVKISENSVQPMRSEIRRMKLGKISREQGTPSQAVVRIVNEAARDQEGNGDGGGSRTPQRGRRPAERNQFGTRKINQIATVLNSIHQFKIQAHMLNRSTSVPEIYKNPVENKCDFEAKDFSKSEAELVDVKDTLQT